MLSLQYVAGFFDGEGSVGITGCKHKRGAGLHTWLRVTITNTDTAILKEIHERCGGTLSKGRLLGVGWKEHRELRFLGWQAVVFMKKIRPYVRVKSKQIALALEYWDFTHGPEESRYDFVVGETTTNFSGKRCIKIRKPSVIAREQEYKDQMHALNRKGVPI